MATPPSIIEKGGNVAPFRSLQVRLILFFLLISIIPLVFTGILIFDQSKNALRNQSFLQLSMVRNLKAQQIEDFFQSVEEDITLMAALPVVIEAANELALTEDFYTVRLLGYLGNPNLDDSGQETPYDAAHVRYHKVFKSIVETRGYGDVYLLTPDGYIAYNFDKGDDFATNLSSGPYRNTHIANLFRDVYFNAAGSKVKFTDFVPYAPSGGIPASFVGTPIIEHGETIGVLVYQLPLSRINELLQSQADSIGKSGETYMVGQDKLMRSNSRFSQDDTILEQVVDNPAVQDALDSQIGVKQITNYQGASAFTAYQPINFGNQIWALIVEIEEEEALGLAARLRTSILITTAIAALAIAIIGFFIARNVTQPIINLTNIAVAVAGKELDRKAKVETKDEIGVLAVAFNTMIDRLRKIIATLEDRVQERTQQLGTVAQVGQELAGILDLEDLLQQIVTLIKETFDYYHVHIYFLDEKDESLNLVEGSGQAGIEMKAKGHKISLDAPTSLIAHAARTGKVIWEHNVYEREGWLSHPLLPDTLSEMAVPIMIGANNQVVGILDVQEDKIGGLNEQDANLLRSLANQIAVAVKNARLFEQATQAKEDAEHANRTKSQFLASMSHELRTPLNAIMSFTEMVMLGMMGPINEEQTNLLDQSLESSKHLLNLINDILDISKIQAGKLVLFVEEDVNLYTEMKTVVGIIDLLLKNEPITLIKDIDDDLPIISGDKRRVRQILINLLTNAIKFTEEGTITFRAKNQGNNVLFAIIDDGPGIPVDMQAAIFEPFIQSADGVKYAEGTGLGLPITKSLVNAHNGRLWLESKLKEGTTFYATLPFKSEEVAHQ